MLDSKFAKPNHRPKSTALRKEERRSSQPKMDLHHTGVIDKASVHSETVAGNCVLASHRVAPIRHEPRQDSPRAILADSSLFDYLADALILMSTPAGRLNLFNASIVLAVAWTMSINRL